MLASDFTVTLRSVSWDCMGRGGCVRVRRGKNTWTWKMPYRVLTAVCDYEGRTVSWSPEFSPETHSCPRLGCFPGMDNGGREGQGMWLYLQQWLKWWPGSWSSVWTRVNPGEGTVHCKKWKGRSLWLEFCFHIVCINHQWFSSSLGCPEWLGFLPSLARYG